MSRRRATRPLMRYSLWPERYKRRPTTTSPGLACTAGLSAVRLRRPGLRPADASAPSALSVASAASLSGAPSAVSSFSREENPSHGRAFGRAVKNAIGHALGAQRLVALLAKDPGDGIHDVGFAAAVGADDARGAVAAERDRRALAERLEADQVDFTELEQVRLSRSLRHHPPQYA